MKRKGSLIFIPLLAAIAITGCQKTPDTPIVAQKKSAMEAKTVESETGMNIKDQLNMPETYETEFSDSQGVIKVKVKPTFVIPDVEGIKLKRVEGRVFTQEELDKQIEVLLKNNKLTERIAVDGGGGMTKSEIEEWITVMKAKIEAGFDFKKYNGDNYNVEEDIANMEAMYEAAPEVAETEVVEPKIGYDPNTGSGEADLNTDVNYLMGDVKIDGQEYLYRMENTWRDDWKWVVNELRRSGETSNYMEIGGGDPRYAELPLSVKPEEAKAKADELVASLGFDYMKAYGGEEFSTIFPDEDMFTEKDPVRGYGIHYTRIVDGIPITYTMENGGTMEEDENGEYAPSWPYEALRVIYDKKGLAEFRWENPYEITNLSDEFVFLLPFDEIKTIFEQMIITKNAQMNEYLSSAEFEIYEIRLGYTRIMEKGKAGTGTLVPAWDFFGKSKYTYLEQTMEDGSILQPEESENAYPYYSLLTINAMDGTVIDRGLGY